MVPPDPRCKGVGQAARRGQTNSTGSAWWPNSWPNPAHFPYPVANQGPGAVQKK
jgi:hypothetical protein